MPLGRFEHSYASENEKERIENKLKMQYRNISVGFLLLLLLLLGRVIRVDKIDSGILTFGNSIKRQIMESFSFVRQTEILRRHARRR